MRIVVLMGGESTERLVSFKSGEAVANGLTRLGHEVYKMDPVFPKQWVTSDQKLFTGSVGEKPPENLLELPKATLRRLEELLEELQILSPDIVFPVLHGGPGEDGTLQGLLEWANIPFVGSSSLTCHIAMDKMITKKLLEADGIKTPRWLFYSKHSKFDRQQVEEDIQTSFGYPCIVKPNSGGSTVGMTILPNAKGLKEAIDIVLQLNDDLLIEEFIEGRELTVAVIADEVMPTIEVVPKSGFYDYTSKYTVGKTEYICPANLTPVEMKQSMELGKKVWDILQARGFGRSDFRLTPKGEMYCLEFNTIPGMTELSLVPKAAAAKNITFDQVLEMILSTVK
ncbi:MAG: D-alanine--D-alanine ligase [bacterium]|nr:D-alanine--D-alanine ligase [bacterium]